MLRSLLVLDNPVQDYAWGSRTAIAAFLGRPVPSPRPEAELWIGAHPKASSRVVEPQGLGSLERVIRDEPVAVLGREACDRFGNELPFLLKLLAAAEPLSIQAHPSREQARRGFARENAEGVPLDDPRRNYRDPNHKPELVSALTSFTAMKGFRRGDEIARRMAPIAGPELSAELATLADQPSPAALRAFLARLLMLDEEERAPLLRRAAVHAARRSRDTAWSWVGRLLGQYPADGGALAPLYLNVVRLRPGEALFLPAGELHAYLEGTALEIMANSDNVLRGGLTPKHVDVPELLATLTFEPRAPERIRPVETGPGERRYETPAEEFELGLIETRRERPFTAREGRGVEVLLGLEGEAAIRTDEQTVALPRGGAVLVPAALPRYVVEGEARLVRASVPAR